MNPFARMYLRRLGLSGWLMLIGGAMTVIGGFLLLVWLVMQLAILAPVIFVAGLVLLGIGMLLSPRKRPEDEDLPYY
ncbi:MAG TPA: hypothetical protein VM389_09255 [Phycisphaerae bacterium]|nr:hypothetical protein [Phycisphaerae bacterium]HUU22708.1 hypothetical protein [Phycisphaerae bacterium]